MKIAAYEVRRDEQKDFAFIAEKRGVELTEAEDNLTLENIDTVNGAEGVTILGRTRFDRALLTAVQERGVKYISTRTIGADHIDLTAAKELGLKVCNSNYAPNGVADYTVMLMLLLACASISPPCGAHRSTTTPLRVFRAASCATSPSASSAPAKSARRSSKI